MKNLNLTFTVTTPEGILSKDVHTFTDFPLMTSFSHDYGQLVRVFLAAKRAKALYNAAFEFEAGDPEESNWLKGLCNEYNSALEQFAIRRREFEYTFKLEVLDLYITN